MAHSSGRRLAATALVVTSLIGVAAVALTALNVGAWVLLDDAARAPAPGPPARAAEVQAALRDVYAHLSEPEMELLLDETWNRPYTFTSWMGFRERPRRGSFVNIAPEGYRRALDGVDLGHTGTRVFALGGSTTFGYGVADDETIPARLEVHLRERFPERDVRVFNFGRGHYFSAQELALLTRLMAEGQHADLVVFLDGYNEGQEVPFFSAEMARHFEERNQQAAKEPSWLSGMPLVRLLDRQAAEDAGQQPAGPKPYMALSPAELNVRWAANRDLIRALGGGLGFEVRIFLQPIAGYRNAHLEHRLQGRWYVDAFEQIRAKVEALVPLADERDTFDATHLLEDYTAQPFVDSLHYTPEVCDLIARYMAERLEL